MRAIVFDLDGTLIDTQRDLAEATNRALEVNGYPACPLEAYTRMVGNGARKLIERALGEACTPETTERVLADFLRIYDAACMVHTRPYADMRELVDTLSQSGLPLLIVTNKPQVQADKLAAHFFPGRFLAVYGGLAGRPAKPDPTVTLAALNQVGASPAESWFFGDSNVDVQTAHAAGMHSAGASWGFRGAQELQEAGVEALLENPLDFLMLVR